MLKFEVPTWWSKTDPVVNRDGKEVVVRVEVETPPPPKRQPANLDFTTYQSGNRYRVYNVAVGRCQPRTSCIAIGLAKPSKAKALTV